MCRKLSFLIFLALSLGLECTAQAEPKYVRFLIGDAMSFKQVKAAARLSRI